MPPTPYYEDEHVTLYCGDCRDVMPTLPKHSAGLLVTDPPYGVGWYSGWAARHGRDGHNVIAGDDGSLNVTAIIADALKHVRHSRHLYVFQQPGKPNVDWSVLPVGSTAELIWDKRTPGLGSSVWGTSHEVIMFAVYRASAANRADGHGKNSARLRRGTVLQHDRIHGNVSRHPTEKPVSLLRELIEMSSKPGDVVLDPFAGVGSTLVAAVLEGRRAVGIELDENYCRIAVERLQAIQPHLNGLRAA